MNTRRILLHNQAPRLARFGNTFALWEPGDEIDGANIIRTVAPIVIERDGCEYELNEGLVNSVMTLAIEERGWRIHHSTQTEHLILCSPTGKTLVYRAPHALLRDAFSPSTRYLKRGKPFDQFRAWAALAAAHGRLHEGRDYHEANETQRYVDWLLKGIGPTAMDSVWVRRQRKAKTEASSWWGRWVKEREAGRVFPEVLDRIYRRRRWWPLAADDLVEILSYMAAWPEWRMDDAPLEFRP